MSGNAAFLTYGNVEKEGKTESRVKLLDYQALLAAKVATFNDRGKVSEYYFATI